ncbi:hypothetical protein A3A39_03175 [Candidatus Kaiserbacteria bacterium RIFCSPLOWO2_01_FULL_54_13]|uniref:Uncharacterized protein n=1 Tax=Candidatus Kaiserbacteria bacterium RIFCSPLOWO2_01_FULL_54_13 TaxID=1798512 RepID=A0A1F6F4C9_9BACT|nr:MAG: hypothetical protein A3A39_03175 [Candidatus Kaiserbacteria bacterium RIFCSPLOWO2_01_FULL_54_13]
MEEFMRNKILYSSAAIAALALVGFTPGSAEAGQRCQWQRPVQHWRPPVRVCPQLQPVYRPPVVYRQPTCPTSACAAPGYVGPVAAQAFAPPPPTCAAGYHLGVGPGGRPWCNRAF